MASSIVYSANIHRLRDSIRSSCIALLFFRRVGFFPNRSAYGARKNHLRPYTAGTGSGYLWKRASVSCNMVDLYGEAVGGSEAINKDINKEEFQMPAHLQKNISSNKVIQRAATVFVFDIETTGFSRKNDRIVEIAIRDLNGGKYSTFESLVNPERIISNSYVHGITYDMVNRPDVPRFKDIIPEFLQYVRRCQINGIPVLFLSHNARRFDVPFIREEFNRCGYEIPSDFHFVDTLPIAGRLKKPDGTKLDSLTLEYLRQYYNIPLMSLRHRAMQDVNTLCFVFQKMTFDLKLSTEDLLGNSFKAS